MSYMLPPARLREYFPNTSVMSLSASAPRGVRARTRALEIFCWLSLTLPETLQMAIDSNAILYTIGLFDQSNRDRNPRILKEIAKDTGGMPFLPSDPRLLPRLCARIATDIRSQYTLGYVSSDHRKDGRFRTVRVVVDSANHRQVNVRTRSGYVAPREPSADLIPREKPGGTP